MLSAEDRQRVIQVVQSEFQTHEFGIFVTHPPNNAQGGEGVVVAGCTTCEVRLRTTEQFLRHLSAKVKEAIEQLSDVTNP